MDSFSDDKSKLGFPRFGNYSVIDLSIAGNEIPKIENTLFEDMGDTLESLNLENCSIVEIMDFGFSPLIKLQTLYLTANKLEKLKVNTLKGLSNLKR